MKEPLTKQRNFVASSSLHKADLQPLTRDKTIEVSSCCSSEIGIETDENTPFCENCGETLTLKGEVPLPNWEEIKELVDLKDVRSAVELLKEKIVDKIAYADGKYEVEEIELLEEFICLIEDCFPAFKEEPDAGSSDSLHKIGSQKVNKKNKQ